MKKNAYKIFIAVFFISTIGITYWLGNVYKNLGELSLEVRSIYEDGGDVRLKPEGQNHNYEEADGCNEACERTVSEMIAEAIATLSASPVNDGAGLVSDQTSYITLGSSYSTKSTDWVNIPDSAVFLNLVENYGENATVSWEASLKVHGDSGKAHARLYDETNGIAVDMSELATTNSYNYEKLRSADLPFWRGTNLYKVQLKSLNSSEINYGGGRLIITKK